MPAKHNVTRTTLAVVAACALVGLLVGGGWAAIEILGRKQVLEFQPLGGQGASLSERGLGIAMRAAIEGFGYGALGLVLALVGLAIARFDRSGASGSRRLVGATLLAAAAFRVWSTDGTWFTNEVLPFLSAPGLLAVNLVGFGSLLALVLLLAILARRLPWCPRGDPAALGLGLALAWVGAALAAVHVLRTFEGGFGSPLNLGLATVCILAAAPVGAGLAAALGPLLGLLETRLASRVLLPRWAIWGLGALLLVCGAVSLPSFELHKTPSEPSYSELASTVGADAPNVILITIDTLRADHLGCYGYPRPTSPFIDELAAGGVRFADPSAPASWTKPSTGTILTGLYPSRHGALYFGSSLRLPEGERTLAETFRTRGYATAGFVSNPNVKRVFDFDRGFDEFFDSPVEDTLTMMALRESSFGGVLRALTRYQFNWKYENDVVTMNRHILAWLEENREQRFFLYLHYIDPHEPYAPPAEYRAEWVQDHGGPLGFPVHNERKRLVGQDLYDGEIRYCDDHLRVLGDELKRHGLWENTLLVVTSDHGEEWFEHGVMGHGFSLYQPVVQVPLIFHGPGVPAGEVVEAPVELVDMPATVLEVAGTGQTELGDGSSFAAAISNPDWQRERKLFLESEFAIEQGAWREFVFTGVREGDLKMVMTEANLYRPPGVDGNPSLELYDLASDPLEQRNLFEDPSYRTAIEALLERLVGHSEFLNENGFRHQGKPALSEQQQAELKALGYGG